MFCLEDLAFAGLERSSVVVGTRLESILEAIGWEGGIECHCQMRSETGVVGVGVVGA